MFNKDFFPTPENVIELMIQGENIAGKVILEPSAGKGDIVDYLTEHGAKNVISCENNEDLKKILQTKCKIIESDFLNLTSDKISHIDFIIMNPPFSADEKHILHAYNIAPAGCKIISLCNTSTVENTHTNSRKELKKLIDSYGISENLGDCFTDAERQTGVNITLIKINKPGSSYKTEFEGFFMDEEPEEAGQIGLMSYNIVRDLVNRYVAAVKLYDTQLQTGQKMNALLSNFYGSDLTFTCSENGAVKLRNEFKKDLQKAGWKFIFNKMDLRKNTTQGLMDDINKFVEQQSEIPFTMRNIYHMLDMVVQTTGQRMDKAILQAFDTITEHHHDNRQYLKGWKTNSHFLVGKKFILPSCVSPSKEYGYTSTTYSYLSGYKSDTIADLEKALCFANSINYDDIKTVYQSIGRNLYAEYYESYFFKYKAFKNGNMHFEFINDDIRGKFNQRVAKLKGYPLFEAKEQTAHQNRQTGRAAQPKANPAHVYKPTILTTIKLKTAI
jgi:hypothetical protein